MITMNSKVKVNGGKTMNMAEFADKFGLDLTNIELVISMAGVLQKQGKLTVVEKTTKEEDLINQANKTEIFQQTVEKMEEEREEAEQTKRESKKADCDTVSFELIFSTTIDAQRFEDWIRDKLRIKSVSSCRENGINKVKVLDVTPSEYSKISAKYTAEKAINASVNYTDKAVTNVTEGVNYMASEVVAPVAKIAGKGAMNLGKGLFHTSLKVLGSLVNNGAKAIEETKYELQTDEELIRAQNQLLNAKHAVARGLRKKMDKTSGGSGINIL